MNNEIEEIHKAGFLISLSSWKDGKWRCHLSKAPLYVSSVGDTIHESLSRAVEKLRIGEFHK